MSDKDGGTAFPFEPVSTKLAGGDTFDVTTYRPGMSLRDYFAAKAMQGMVSSAFKYLSESDDKDAPLNEQAMKMLHEVGEVSYMMADKMLAEREKE